MNDKLPNDHDNFEESNNKAQINICAACKKNPCVCSDNKEQTKTKRPRISWI